MTTCPNHEFSPSLSMRTSLPESDTAGATAVRRRRVASWPMRITEFRALMVAHFGDLRAPSVARDHVFSALAGRTADEALAAGEDPKVIWRAVCDDLDVSDALRYGLPD